MVLGVSGTNLTGAIGTIATTAQEMAQEMATRRTGLGTATTPVGGMTTPGDETQGMAKLGPTARTLLGTGMTAGRTAAAVAAPGPAEEVVAAATGGATTDAAAVMHGTLPVLAARMGPRGRRSRRVATLRLRCRLRRCPLLGLARTGEGRRPGSHRQRGPGEGAWKLPRLRPTAACPWGAAVAVHLGEGRTCQGDPRRVLAPGLLDLSLRDLPGCRARLTTWRDWRAAGRTCCNRSQRRHVSMRGKDIDMFRSEMRSSLKPC